MNIKSCRDQSCRALTGHSRRLSADLQHRAAACTVRRLERVRASRSAGTAGGPGRGKERRRGMLSALCVAWVLATPLADAPDGPAQKVKAAATTVRGEFTGRPMPHQPGAVREFRVPPCSTRSTTSRSAVSSIRRLPQGALRTRSSGRVITSTSYVGSPSASRASGV